MADLMKKFDNKGAGMQKDNSDRFKRTLVLHDNLHVNKRSRAAPIYRNQVSKELRLRRMGIHNPKLFADFY